MNFLVQAKGWSSSLAKQAQTSIALTFDIPVPNCWGYLAKRCHGGPGSLMC